MRVDEVVDALVERLGLDPAKRANVKSYYQRLEQGFLEPGRVSRRVWAVVGTSSAARSGSTLAGSRPRVTQLSM